MIGTDYHNFQFFPAEILENFQSKTDHNIIVAGWKNVYHHMMHNKNCYYIVNDLHDTSRCRKMLNFPIKNCVFLGDAVYKVSNHISSPWSEFIWMTKNFKQKNISQSHWICLMSKSRYHRLKLFDLMVSHDWLFQQPNYFVFDEAPNSNLDAYMFRKKIPHSYHKQQHSDFVMNTNKDHWPDGDLIYPYSNGMIELVTETETDMFFITEKIIKPIQAKIPFVVIGSYKFLYNLRKLGFKTFDSIIDESYDQEIDLNIRIERAFESFVEYVKNPKDCVEVCDHNANILHKIQAKKDYRKSLLKRKINSVINSIYGS